MKKELMWACGLLDEVSLKKIRDICVKANSDMELSTRFLDFPFHVSYKRSFYTDEYEKIFPGLKELIKEEGRIACGSVYLQRIGDMIWLRFEKEDGLKALHEKADHYLGKGYGIEIDPFDKTYVPHVTLFRDESEEKLDQMYEKLESQICVRDVWIERSFIGTKNRENIFFDMKREDK